MAKTRNHKSHKAQSKAFIAAARELGGDESRERFDSALRIVGRQKSKAEIEAEAEELLRQAKDALGNKTGGRN